MLTYLHSLCLLLEPSDVVNSSDVRLAVSRIVTWTTEPKSVDVRKVQFVLVGFRHCLRQLAHCVFDLCCIFSLYTQFHGFG